MCGIIGVVGVEDTASMLIDGLKRLEYRGYDSAGIAALVNGQIERRRAEGKIINLERVNRDHPIENDLGIGIGHTRWASHGAPTETNAHPHATDRVAVVHNGIIENHKALRRELEGLGRHFVTQTDTEVVPQLITHYLDQGLGPVEATAKTLARLEGAFALAVIFAGEPDLLIGARRGSPLAVGYGDGAMYLGSDAITLAPLTNRIAYLEEGDWVVVNRDGARVFDESGAEVERPVQRTELSGAAIGKGNHRHFMIKEIYEQPGVIGDTLRTFVDAGAEHVELDDVPFDFADVPRLTIVACGTSFYAAMVAKYWFEQIARLPVEIDIASEFRYREAPLAEGGAALFISQSGETADTLAAMRHAKNQGQHTVVVVNVPTSSMAREADVMLQTKAGPEIGVASTKAFTCQLVTLACLALYAAHRRGAIDDATMARLTHEIAEVPSRAADVLSHDDRLREIAHGLTTVHSVLYIGRGTAFPIALEGALKLKEISYIHAEAYAAGELKHGPIALIDDGMPVVAIAPSGRLFDKLASNVEEIAARDGRIILITDADGASRLGDVAAELVVLPKVADFVAPILYALPVQLLAYHVAVLKGTDVDQPRNLAKSVTVE